ncbi:hypothetical protein BKA62DRAFT_369696 [Auriculariales sp. MPI-PUGE-AT-0066]|nr:hypothetical protein BKA62DRAFT_369696 [Auriculariales sp. MPI-PUGE-AT-0066]
MAAEFQSALLNTLIRELNAAMHSHLPDVPRNAKHHATAVSHLRSLQPIIHGLVDEAVATVGRRVNQFAAVNRLNEDTLVLIFAELLDITSRANVAWVCQRWRRAVCATPTLWNHVDLWAGHPGFRATVQQSCERSAHLPIDVKFSFSEPEYLTSSEDESGRPDYIRGSAWEQLDYLRNALFTLPPDRVRSVELQAQLEYDGDPETVGLYSWPSLQSLKINWSSSPSRLSIVFSDRSVSNVSRDREGHPVPFTNADFTALRRLHLSGANISMMAFPYFKSVIDLRLDANCVQEAVGERFSALWLLSCFPNITDIQLVNIHQHPAVAAEFSWDGPPRHLNSIYFSGQAAMQSLQAVIKFKAVNVQDVQRIIVKQNRAAPNGWQTDIFSRSATSEADLSIACTTNSAKCIFDARKLSGLIRTVIVPVPTSFPFTSDFVSLTMEIEAFIRIDLPIVLPQLRSIQLFGWWSRRMPRNPRVRVSCPALRTVELYGSIPECTVKDIEDVLHKLVSDLAMPLDSLKLFKITCTDAATSSSRIAIEFLTSDIPLRPHCTKILPFADDMFGPRWPFDIEEYFKP